MKIFADIRQEVSVNQKDFIQQMIEEVLGYGWIAEDEGRFYIYWDTSVGPKSVESRTEISIEKYNYIKNLQEVLTYLNEEQC